MPTSNSSQSSSKSKAASNNRIQEGQVEEPAVFRGEEEPFPEVSQPPMSSAALKVVSDIEILEQIAAVVSFRKIELVAIPGLRAIDGQKTLNCANIASARDIFLTMFREELRDCESPISKDVKAALSAFTPEEIEKTRRGGGF